MLKTLRKNIQALHGDSALIFRTNRFLDTYGVLQSENWVQHISQFTGSSGVLWVGGEAICLFTDSRYYVQARKECTKDVQIFDLEQLYTYIRTHSRTLVIDPWYLSVHQWEDLQEKLFPCIVRAHSLLSSLKNAEAPQCTLTIPSLGRTSEAWNMWFQEPTLVCRSEDLSFLCRMGTKNLFLPTLKGYGLGLYNADSRLIQWWIGFEGTISHMDTVPAHIQLLHMENWKHFIRERFGERTIYYIPQDTPLGILDCLTKSEKTFFNVALMRCEKTPEELDVVRQAHVQEGVAFTTFLYWISEEGWKGSHTEYSAAQYLESLRQQCPNYQSPSFPTISAMGLSGAIIHYVPKEHSACSVEAGPYLIDAGGQYYWGTTDMTRSLWLGPNTPDSLYQEDYTEVLQGHIDVAMSIFPEGTLGSALDTIARSPLWKAKKNYAHSTGHGVGVFSNVHEGPINLSSKCKTELKSGMICSNEPGMYRLDRWGIRLENLCVVSGKEWLGLHTISLAPFQRCLIQPEILGKERISWLNAYHKQVFNTLKPYLLPKVCQWLFEQTREF